MDVQTALKLNQTTSALIATKKTGDYGKNEIICMGKKSELLLQKKEFVEEQELKEDSMDIIKIKVITE